MPHASWKGYLSLSLVSVPVQAFNVATSAKGEISFNQLHDKCKSRIRYVKTCPIHGDVPNNEIVKGYEYAKDQYVIVDDAELKALRAESNQSVVIDTFVKPDAIDPKYFDGRCYYLVPDGDRAAHPYAVMLEALQAKNLWGIATATISNREQLLVLRAAGDTLCADALHFAAELRSATEIGAERVLRKVAREEVKLAGMLIDASTSKRFDINRYEDNYESELREMLEAKAQGHKLVKAPKNTPAPVINLMDALRKSVAKTSKAKLADQAAKDVLSRAAKKPRKVVRRESAG